VSFHGYKSKTAAMLEPYQGSSDNIGMTLSSEDELYELGVTAAKAGFSLSIHAIGDRANRSVLNVLEKILRYEKELVIPPLPHRIDHVQLIDTADVPRLAFIKYNCFNAADPCHLGYGNGG